MMELADNAVRQTIMALANRDAAVLEAGRHGRD
jgi:hypothetical protein